MDEPAAHVPRLRKASEIPQKERFFRYFQQEVNALQAQVERLKDTALVGSERIDATDHLVAGIARLGSEVGDASSYLPAYDQRTYGEAVKALREKLDETRASFTPRTRFTFKTLGKNPSAVSVSDAAEIATREHRSALAHDATSSRMSMTNDVQTPEKGSPDPLPAPHPSAAEENSDEALEDGRKENANLNRRMAADRGPTFNTSSTISISRQSNAHIILPSSVSHASKPCSLTSLKDCVVDISVPSWQNAAPFPGMTIKNVKGSLLVCGIVKGPAHITAVEGSVLVVTCRQFRMHECKDVDVYLSCSSRPIIEDCSGIRFAPLPDTYRLSPPSSSSPSQDFPKNVPDPDPAAQPSLPAENLDRWSQVDDFKWLKQEPSPNWSLLPHEHIVPDEVWRELVPGEPGCSLEDVLRAVRVLT